DSSLVITRAGATSIAEISSAERPAIYIPHPHSKDNHQLYNAKYVENLGAAVVIEETTSTQEDLQNTLISLLDNPSKLNDMANKVKRAKIPNKLPKFIEMLKKKILV
ncbi:UDP-N-acetylglucosamine--N-acetylmuramyl-(pentapeptide) pyrophosphoryl-undecaprenol N-acetylglucosamine transferase, partial [Wolbachia endosymbiont of Pentidionis agamae]|uniref:UDP-N-acetylglucosamine--N-acetylmuramyl- (pentapeptide) pyrophosphoryl-undecaprenol N-acetylglucosamine transferase n=1 Tax=Wolbachia endosymbiont of Pentidionis agamae TaxID=3110435 RepID=UPI002FD575A5